jgi:hypothetical protein
MNEGLREVNVNGVRYFQADDVERWHRGNVAKAEEWDELSEQVETLRAALSNLRETVDFYTSGDVGIPELADAMNKAFAVLYPTKAPS